ncbi:MAG: response regulator [Planctomycetota bacterium]|nr:response regulator [Planctomycetota bacterium]
MKTRPHILVIDDDPLFRTLMMSILGREFIVAVSSEGSEGFQLAIDNPPDIVIIDLLMPGWDGMRTLQAIKSHPSLNQVKVVIMTSVATRKSVLEAIQSGANDYIIKASFRREEFLAKLLRLLPEWTCEAFDNMKGQTPNRVTAVSPKVGNAPPPVESANSSRDEPTTTSQANREPVSASEPESDDSMSVTAPGPALTNFLSR